METERLQLEAGVQALAAEREEFTRYVEAETQKFAALRQALDAERKAFDQQREAVRQQAERRATAEHRAFVEHMRGISATAGKQRAEHHLEDGIFDAMLAEFESSLDALDGIAPAGEEYRSARERVVRNSAELAQALHRSLNLILARRGDETSRAQLAATEAQNSIFAEQLRLGRQSIVTAAIGVVLTAIYMVFTGVNYGTGTAVNLNALKQG
jgi:hypothetical protein